MITHAVLGTDFSKAVTEIISHLGSLKSIGLKKLTLVHVLNLRDSFADHDFTIEAIEKKLQQQGNILTRKGFNVTTELIFGIPYIELERKRKAVGADITIIGSHGRTSFSSIIGGTVADVLLNMKAPVLVIPLKKIEAEVDEFPDKNLYQYEQIMEHLKTQEPDWNLKSKDFINHVLIPTDFSDFSEAAFQLIKKQDVKLPKVTLLHIQDKVKIESHLKHKLDDFNQIDMARLNRIKTALITAHPETKVDIKILYGNPTEQILKYTEENSVSLTAMGSQGRGFFEKIFLGSVSHQVARQSSSNVLLVPTEKR